MQNACICYLDKTTVQYPDKVAIDDASVQYTFAELRQKSLYWANAIEKSINGEHNLPIAVYLPKSADCIAAFSAILYSGNCYVPLDTKMPEARLIKIIENLQPALILTEQKYRGALGRVSVEHQHLLFLDDIELNGMSEPTGYLHTIDTDPAYIIYTSGSTGVPKGVVVSHRGIIDYIEWARKCYSVNQSDRIGNQSPFYFDNSTLDIYLCLSTGAELDIIPEGLFSFPIKLLDFLRERQINSIFWVPSVLVNIANTESLTDADGIALQRVLFAGEVMPNKQLNYWRKALPNALFSNLYGPTEITVDCTYYIVNREFHDEDPLPIGIPCNNTGVMVLSSEDKLVSMPGEIGELCVRGTSLALGYWHNPEKTVAAFKQNPLNEDYPELIYHTGDLVAWNEYGELMYCGRKDSQIKHMGYRIELGEIEVAAGSLPQMHKVCALYDNVNKRIVLYYEASEEIPVRDIRIALAKFLPKYMIPTVYYWMKSMPENMNGKIDRNRLKQELVGEKK